MTHPAPNITTPPVDPSTAVIDSDEAPTSGDSKSNAKPFSLNGDSGPTPLPTPPLSSSANPTTATAPPPATTAGSTAPGNPPTATTATDSKSEGAEPSDKAESTPHGDADEHSDAPAEPDANAAASMPPELSSALNGLTGLGSQLAGPLIGAATGLPAAALGGLGSLVPSLASAVLPQLAQLANQLGTGAPPEIPTARLASDNADALAGPMGDMAGEGIAGDAARATNQDLALQVNAMREVERRLGEVLGLSSARTEADRVKIKNVITDVETALRSAGVQGDTPEARAAVMTAMRKALDDAGDIVSTAAREKLTDAQFVRSLTQDYLSAADTLHAGTVAGRGAGSTAARAAHNALGIPYVWGGGGALGPSKGGFDCSGLTSYAIARGSHGRVILPRTTYDQIKTGRQVALNRLVPGDLVFSNFSKPGRPEHVAIYIGNGQVIEAPHRGAPVRVAQIPSGAQARRVL